MSLGDLIALYLLVGVACSVAIYRTAPMGGPRAAAEAAVAIPLWPLWAPIALTSRGARSTKRAELAPEKRVVSALREAIEASQGTPLEALLPREAATKIEAEVARASARIGELDELLKKDAFDVDAALARLRALEKDNALPRAVATARLHHDNVKRLYALRDRDARTLEELADLVGALRTQLVLARYAGSDLEGASGTLSEVIARVEALGDVLEDDAKSA